MYENNGCFLLDFTNPLLWLGSSSDSNAPSDLSQPPHSQSQTASLSPTPTPKSTSSDVVCTAYKIRERHHMTLFTSTGYRPIQYPHSFGRPATGDIFVHAGDTFQTQTWMRTVDGVWSAVQEGQSHPSLPDHRLYRRSADDRPRWVHKNTVSTYKSRQKRHRLCELYKSDTNVD
jgi:hypothetical protein